MESDNFREPVAAPRGTGGTHLPSSQQDQFCISSKSDEKSWERGNILESTFCDVIL